jgi:ABC-type nitrate/sulfonate/bicarbonate transport system substrate-binding protein
MGNCIRTAAASALTAALALPLAIPVHAADAVKMGNIGSANSNLWPTLIAANKGFYAAEGLDVDIVHVQSSAGLVQQQAASSLDISMTTGMVDIIRAIDKGAPVALIRIETQSPPYALVAKPAIKDMKGLKGKTISIGGPKDITRIFLERMLKPNGINPGDYDLVFAGSTQARAAALLGGAVDATLLVPPFNFQAEAAGFNRLGLTVDYAADLPFGATIAGRKWATASPTVLEKLLRAQHKAIAWFYDERNKAEAVAILGAQSSIKPADLEKSYDFYRSGHYFDNSGTVSKRKLGALLQVMHDLGDLADTNMDRFVVPGLTRVSE